MSSTANRDSLTEGALLGGRWRLETWVGAGGMGEVWRARHEVLGRVAALKLVKNPDRASRDRLLLEARILASIRHPAVVEVFDFGEHDGAWFYVMELLEGRSLGERIRSEGVVAVRPAVELAAQVLDGLEVVHRGGVVHRDVKPDNVFLVATPLGERPKLVDFGIARVRAQTSRLTLGGQLVGTPDYIAPEQLQGAEPDSRTDVWAIGITLYEAIHGRAPFESDDIASTLQRVLNDAPVRTKIADVDDALWRILNRALDKSPSRRFPTAEAFADALRLWLRGGTDAPALTQTLPAPPSSAVPGREVDPLRGALDTLLRGKLTPR